MDKQFYVYILASRRNGTLYVGMTSDLIGRVWTHKNDVLPGFTRRYKIHTLVWFEVHGDAAEAGRRERQIKEWKRAWKIAMIEATNPDWDDLYPGLF